jgi:WD repeat-containing protein 61
MKDWILSIDILLVNAWSLAFSPDGQYLATGSFGGKVDLYNTESGQKEKTLDTQTKFVLSAIYVRKQKHILCYKDIDKYGFRVLMENY